MSQVFFMSNSFVWDIDFFSIMPCLERVSFVHTGACRNNMYAESGGIRHCMYRIYDKVFVRTELISRMQVIEGAELRDGHCKLYTYLRALTREHPKKMTTDES